MCACRGGARRPWVGDLETLRGHVEARYANLPWAKAHGVDPEALAAAARRELERAGSLEEARLALDEYLQGFGDPRLRVRVELPVKRGPSCAPPRARGAVLWEQVVTPLPGGPFVRGVVDGIGVIRIPSLRARDYPEVCALDWREGEADWPARAARRLDAELATAVQALRAAGARAIALDLTGNPGGADWRPDPPADLVLVDGRTAGEAELLAARLIDERDAVALGAPSAGDGCLASRAPIRLLATGLTVDVPDCVTRRKDGGNLRDRLRPAVGLTGEEWTPAAGAALAEAYRRKAK
jgi:hypothetical protein